MSKVKVYDKEGQTVGEVELNAEIFENQINVPVMHQAVRIYLASRQRGTHDVKTRAEVSGGGKKPWRQKGTGRASFGSSRNPVWRTGGVAFGPTPRSHEITMPKKMRRLALLSALSSKAMDGDIVVVDDLYFEAPKTKELARVLTNIKAPNALVVLEQDNKNAILSARNLPDVTTSSATGLNTFKVLYNRKLVLTRSSLASLEEVLG
jgi:large subunit ribosomal protein L4